jgi:serine protease
MSVVRFVVLFILMIVNIGHGLLAQNFKKGSIPNSVVKQVGINIVPGVLIVKLKPEHRDFSNDLNALLRQPVLSEIFKKSRVSKFEKMFSASKPPVAATDTKIKKYVDISLIHTLHFDAGIPVNGLIKTVMASGLFQYAEPQYLDQIAYIPNDSLARQDSLQSLLFNTVRAYQAWGIEKGDTNVVIGVLDTGTELTHPDLKNNIKYNYADPIDGFDNDHDGYFDNFYGWDIAMGDNDPSWQGSPHGVEVQGACSASADNIIGVAGSGFNCKALPIKVANSTGSISAGYQGIQYAASHGVKIINISWGGYGTYSQASQDIINDAVFHHDVLIIASAGNTEGELDFYPASYDNVISVSGLDTLTSPSRDTTVCVRKTWDQNINPGVGMSYSFKVDLASLEGGFTTGINGKHKYFDGSSYASPVVAGAAALVRSKYPQLSALQAGELLRVSGEILDTFDVTRPESRYKIGKQLNMYKALNNITTPSIRMLNYSISSAFSDSAFFSGDTLTITNDFFNYLSTTNNLTVKMICSNGNATVVDGISALGVIKGDSSKRNLNDPFKIVVNNGIGSGAVIELVLIMTDPTNNYYDFQGFKITVNPAYLSLDTNKVKTTITSTGRIGFTDITLYPALVGLGVTYSGNELIYESGLMIGLSPTKVSNCVRNTSALDDDFKSIQAVRYDRSALKDMEAICTFNDSLASSIIGVKIEQRSYEWKNAPNDKFAIIEYKITNQSNNTYDSIFAGLFTDWDILAPSPNTDPNNDPFYNRADWDAQHKVAYTYSTIGGTKVGGIALLTDNVPSCFSTDNSNVGGNNINAGAGLTTAQKYTMLSNGIDRPQAGMSGLGNDVSQVTAAKITNFASGDVETVAFAIITADDIPELLTIAQSARDKFVSIKQGPVPVTPNATICRHDTVNITFTPTTGNTFGFFTSPPPALPVHTGTVYTMTNVSNADTIYIANKDSLFYSNYETVYIKKDAMTLNFYPNTDTTNIAHGSSLLLVNQSSGTSSLSWDLGDGNTAIGNSVSHQYTSTGYYTIELIAVSPMSCKDTLKRVIKVNGTDNESSLNGITLDFYPNPVANNLTIEFSNNTPPEDLSLELINALGSIVFTSDKGTKNTIIDMSGYSSGIYYLKLKSGNSMLSKKIVKN